MKLKRCLGSEIPSPAEGKGIFYIDQETNNLKLKKSNETISWYLVGVDKYKDVDAETARLCHILENDDTEGYKAKVLIQFKNDTTSILLDENNYVKKWVAFKTSDRHFYTDVQTLSHTFADNCADKYIICYYNDNTSYTNEWQPLNSLIEKIDRAISFNFDFTGFFKCLFFGWAATGMYKSITFLDCNFEHVNELDYFALGEDQCEKLYILNQQTKNSLNFINVNNFGEKPVFGTFGPKYIFGIIELSNQCTSIGNTFCNSSITVCPYINTSNVIDFSGMFYCCGRLTTAPLLDLTNANNCDEMFASCDSLRYLGGFKELKVDLSLANSPLLVRASLLNVLNNLADVTELGTNPTLILAADSYVKLTAEEIAIGTNKGWTIAYA